MPRTGWWLGLLCASCLHAQPAPGVIRGTITGPQGPAAQASVIAQFADGRTVQAISANDGTFSLAIAPGTYDVFITKIQHTAVSRRGVSVTAGSEIVVNAALGSAGQNAQVPGENTFQLIAEQRAPVDGLAPRMPDGKPDLSGVWLPSANVAFDDAPYLPWAAKLQRERTPGGDPRAHCLPSGVVRTNVLDLTKHVQTPDLLVILIEGSPPGFRQIFLDGRAHPSDLEPSWMGHSTGRWDGDVLVIDTVGFHDRGWLDAAGRPQTEKLHVIERLRRTSLGSLDVEITVDDPGAYERPWKLRRILKLAPDEEIREYVCNENEKSEHYR